MESYSPEINEEIIKSIEEDPERKKHMDLLANAFFDTLERGYCGYGGWGHDDKRPFGNSLVEPDIAEIVGYDREAIYDDNGNYDEDLVAYLNGLYSDLGPYLKYKWFKFVK